MRGCTISNTDNTKKYLKANDWTKWEDGTTSSQDSSGVSVEAFVEFQNIIRYYAIKSYQFMQEDFQNGNLKINLLVI